MTTRNDHHRAAPLQGQRPLRHRAARGAGRASSPTQPSRKDGLGVMCTEHWRAYVKGLREARMATTAVRRGHDHRIRD